MTAQELYGVDFFEWAKRNAELLSQGCFVPENPQGGR
jgi:hypothetical protein